MRGILLVNCLLFLLDVKLFEIIELTSPNGQMASFWRESTPIRPKPKKYKTYNQVLLSK